MKKLFLSFMFIFFIFQFAECLASKIVIDSKYTMNEVLSFALRKHLELNLKLVSNTDSLYVFEAPANKKNMIARFYFDCGKNGKTLVYNEDAQLVTKSKAFDASIDNVEIGKMSKKEKNVFSNVAYVKYAIMKQVELNFSERYVYGFVPRLEKGCVVVDQITAGEPMDEAGICIGDEIVEINGMKLLSNVKNDDVKLSELRVHIALDNLPTNRANRFLLKRGGKLFEKEIRPYLKKPV